MDGEWIAGSSAPDDKAILYFHGGGFRLGSVSSHRELIARIAGASGCRVLAINYRLAPEHRFPAPLEDTLAAYGWMLDQGLRPENIALAGDSAGGDLGLRSVNGEKVDDVVAADAGGAEEGARFKGFKKRKAGGAFGHGGSFEEARRIAAALQRRGCRRTWRGFS